MGWSIGYDRHWQRDIGYGVPATCDYPGCGKEIDRGLAYLCEGCGLFFCGPHGGGSECERCEPSAATDAYKMADAMLEQRIRQGVRP